MATPAEEIEVGDRVVRITNPDRVYFPEPRRDQARPRRLLPARRRRHRPRAARAAVHAAPLPDGRGRREGAPEAGAARARRRGWRRCGCTSRATAARRRAVRHRAGQRDLGGADVDRRVPPLELPPRRHRAARTSGASTSTRCRTATSPTVRRVAARGARGARRARRGRLAEDLRRPGPARLRPDRARARVHRTSAGRRWPSPARWSAARRTTSPPTWWRKDRDPAALFVDYNQNARDHTIATAYSVRGVPDGTGLHADPLGRDRRRRPARLHHRHRAGAVRRARRPARRHRRRRLRPRRRCWSGPSATSGEGARDLIGASVVGRIMPTSSRTLRFAARAGLAAVTLALATATAAAAAPDPRRPDPARQPGVRGKGRPPHSR